MPTITMLALRRIITMLRMRTMRLPCRISVILCIRCALRWSCGLFYYLGSRCHRVLFPSSYYVAALTPHHLRPSAFAHLLSSSPEHCTIYPLSPESQWPVVADNCP